MIRHTRLRNQHITQPFEGSAADLVLRFGAVQAQEYGLAAWGLSLRLAGQPDLRQVEQAFDRGDILRTHVMRPTWHFVAPDDIAWLLTLTAPRVFAATGPYFRSQELDRRLLARATRTIERELEGESFKTRRELAVGLARKRISLAATRLALVMLYAELSGVVCSGPRRGNKFTYALLDERTATRRRRVMADREEALGELARRFYACHGPATIRDFVWWSGLTTADARRGVAMIGATRQQADGLDYWALDGMPRSPRGDPARLLPVYDEYLVAYRDRVAVPMGPATVGSGERAITFRNALLIDGLVAGTWRTQARGGETTLRVTPLRRLTRAEVSAIDRAAQGYGRFAGSHVTLTCDRT